MKKINILIKNIIGLSIFLVVFSVSGENRNLAVKQKTKVDSLYQRIESASPSSGYIWLHVDGQYIKKSFQCTDPEGIWMGCGMARKCDLSTPTAAQAEYFAKWCKSNHFNLVRIRWDINESDSVIINKTINPYLKALKAQKIYSILDCHSDMRDGWEANNPTGRCKTWLENWLAIAEYYKHEPWIMGYELNNEPRMNSASMVRDLYLKCIQNIRSVDKRHILILCSYNWTQQRGRSLTWEKGLPA